MTSLIQCQTDSEIAYIWGDAKNVEKSTIDGIYTSQLRRASECGGLVWLGKNVKEIVIHDVMVYDEVDVLCLEALIEKKIKIDLSESKVSPNAFDRLSSSLQSLKERGIRVIEGSSICLLPNLEFLDSFKTKRTKLFLEEFGFKVSIMD